MNIVEQVRKEMEDYLPELTKKADFDEFWAKTIEISNSEPLCEELTEFDYPCDNVKVYDLTFKGWGGTTIHGWYILPTFVPQENLPVIIQYHGFNGDRGMPSDFMKYSIMGIAVITIDIRDQRGETGDSLTYSNAAHNSVINRGILDKDEYYLRAVYMDCYRTIDFASSRPELDADKFILQGGSQGGGLVMVMAALDDRGKLIIGDVPSSSDLEGRVVGFHGMFSAVGEYIKRWPDRYDACIETLSYFDTMNMAEKITAPIITSVGGKDPICPPKCFAATYNRVTAPKELYIYPLNGHEGGGRAHDAVKLQAIKDFIS